MLLLVLGLVLFLGVHSVSIFAEPFRNRLAEQNEIAWKAGYGVVSLVGIVLICKGYAAARMDPVWLWSPPAFLSHLVALLMLPMFVFFIASYLPGKISDTLKHPQLVAVKLWAASHLLVNGTLADVLLFGSFLAWAVADRISLKRRTPRPLQTAPRSGANDFIAIGIGLALYLLFVFWAHRALIGVAPFG
ncbi:MAG: NnrU family protein [Pseudomonadales bacterium]|jgi:uncharacterized membrane protein|nr:NnrU family protein [Pseudomonadales bacterium]